MKTSYKLFIAFFSIFMIAVMSVSNISIAQSRSDVYTLSTRDHFDEFGNVVVDDRSYEPFDFQSLGCPEEVVVYIHGVWTSSGTNQNYVNEDQAMMLDNASEIIDRTRISLDRLGYTFPLIGFTWDSDTDLSSDGWQYAKIIAKDNGAKLAQFIVDLENYCKQLESNEETKIRLIGHSLGARVLLSTLENLFRGNELLYKIESVNLMGAAVDNDEISKNPDDVFDSNYDNTKFAFGEAIERTVSKFYNLVNAEDDVLESGGITYDWFGNLFYLPYNVIENQPVYYPYYEQDLALGQSGIQSSIFAEDLPQNYFDIPNIELEIPDLPNANKDNRCDLVIPVYLTCTIANYGDNHMGYAGFIDEFDIYRDNGAMDVVVTSWFNNS
jgi:pimeloyl-ACP methyl ester carboxylesterase